MWFWATGFNGDRKDRTGFVPCPKNQCSNGVCRHGSWRQCWKPQGSVALALGSAVEGLLWKWSPGRGMAGTHTVLLWVGKQWLQQCFCESAALWSFSVRTNVRPSLGRSLKDFGVIENALLAVACLIFCRLAGIYLHAYCLKGQYTILWFHCTFSSGLEWAVCVHSPIASRETIYQQ